MHRGAPVAVSIQSCVSQSYSWQEVVQLPRSAWCHLRSVNQRAGCSTQSTVIRRNLLWHCVDSASPAWAFFFGGSKSLGTFLYSIRLHTMRLRDDEKACWRGLCLSLLFRPSTPNKASRPIRRGSRSFTCCDCVFRAFLLTSPDSKESLRRNYDANMIPRNSIRMPGARTCTMQNEYKTRRSYHARNNKKRGEKNPSNADLVLAGDGRGRKRASEHRD